MRLLTRRYIRTLPFSPRPSSQRSALPHPGPFRFYFGLGASAVAVILYLHLWPVTAHAFVRATPFFALGVVTYTLERWTKPSVSRLRQEAQRFGTRAADLLPLNAWLEQDLKRCRALYVNGDWLIATLLFTSFMLGLPEGWVPLLMIALAVWASVRLYLSLRCAHDELALSILRYSKMPR